MKKTLLRSDAKLAPPVALRDQSRMWRITLLLSLLVAATIPPASAKTPDEANRASVANALHTQGYGQAVVAIEGTVLWLELPSLVAQSSGEPLGRAVRIAHESVAESITEIRVRLRGTLEPDCFIFSRALLTRYYQRMLPRRQLIDTSTAPSSACEAFPNAPSFMNSAAIQAVQDVSSNLLAGWTLWPFRNANIILQPIAFESRIQNNSGDLYVDGKSYLHVNWQPGNHWRLAASGYARWQETEPSEEPSQNLQLFEMDARRFDSRSGFERAFIGWRTGNQQGGVAITAGLLDDYLAGLSGQVIIPSGLRWLNFEARLDRVVTREGANQYIGHRYQTSALAGVNFYAWGAYARLLGGRFAAGDDGAWLGAGYRFANGIDVQIWGSSSRFNDQPDDLPEGSAYYSDEHEQRFGLTLVIPLGGPSASDYTLQARDTIDDFAQLVSRPLDLHGEESMLRPSHKFNRFGQ